MSLKVLKRMFFCFVWLLAGASVPAMAQAAVQFDAGDIIELPVPSPKDGFTLALNQVTVDISTTPFFAAAEQFRSYVRVISAGRLRVVVHSTNGTKLADMVINAGLTPTTTFDMTITVTRTGATVARDGSVVATASYADSNIAMPFLVNTTNAASQQSSGSFAIAGMVYTAANGTVLFSENGNAAAWNTRLTQGSVTDIGAPTDTTAPILAEITPVPDPTTNTTVSYTFASDEAGMAVTVGSCGVLSQAISAGNTTLTFGPLALGTYSDCAVTVTDAAGNASLPLAVTSFTVTSSGGGDTVAPVLAEVIPVPDPTTNTTVSYTLNTDEAGIATTAGSCGILNQSVNAGDVALTFGPLALGTYSDCAVTVTDAAGNTSAPLLMAAFTVISGGGTSTSFTFVDIPQNRMVYDINKANGGTTADIPVSGTATTGEVIEGFDAGAGIWRTIATADASGNWSGTLSVTNVDGSPWYQLQLRTQSNPGAVLIGTNTFSPGTVFAMLSQSEFQHMIQSYQSQHFVAKHGNISVDNPDALQILYVVNDTAVTPQLVYYDVRTGHDLTVNMATLSNFLNQHAPGHKFLFLDMMHSGTGRSNLMNDTDTKRRWSHLQAIVDWVRNNGSEVGLIASSWWAGDVSSGSNFSEWFAPLYLCENWDGSAFTLGTTNLRGVRVDHCFWDVAVPSDQQGRGIFSRDRTKYVEFGINRFLPGADMQNATINLNGGTEYKMVNVERMTVELRQFFADPRVQSFSVPWVALATYHDIGEYDAATNNLLDATHPTDDSFDGLPLMAKHMGVAVLRALGYINYGSSAPAFTSAQFAADGSYVDVMLTTSSTGLFTTPRLKRGEAPLGNQQPYYTEVMGFEISQGSSGWTPSGFTAQFIDQAIGIVRITPNIPFQSGDKVTFGRGGTSLSYTDAIDPIDELNQTWKNFPIQDVGIGNYDGIPVQRVSPVFVK